MFPFFSSPSSVSLSTVLSIRFYLSFLGLVLSSPTTFLRLTSETGSFYSPVVLASSVPCLQRATRSALALGDRIILVQKCSYSLLYFGRSFHLSTIKSKNLRFNPLVNWNPGAFSVLDSLPQVPPSSMYPQTFCSPIWIHRFRWSQSIPFFPS